MAATSIKLEQPYFYDQTTLDEIDRLGVAAARAILKAEEVNGAKAESLYRKADDAIAALCDLVHMSLDEDPFKDGPKPT